MSKSDQKLESKKNVISRILEEGSGKMINVNWMEGTAPEQFNDKPVDISGTITAPHMFLEKRTGEFYPKTAHCLVSRTDGKMVLVINEQAVSEKYTVTGQIEVGKKFTELGINTYKNGLTPLELVMKLRLRRSIFKSVSAHATLLTVLSNVEAKIDKEINESKDDRANHNLMFRQKVTSNIPQEFTLVIPIIEGEEPVEIQVAVLLEVENSRIVCYLESVDGADLIETAFEELVNTEVDKIKDLVTVIYR